MYSNFSKGISAREFTIVDNFTKKFEKVELAISNATHQEFHCFMISQDHKIKGESSIPREDVNNGDNGVVTSTTTKANEVISTTTKDDDEAGHNGKQVDNPTKEIRPSKKKETKAK